MNFEIKNSDNSNDKLHQIDNHFDNIRNIVKIELQQAKQNILIAVAWFTDNMLIETLIEKLDEGLKVKILLSNDQINRKVDFSDFMKKGGKVWFIPKEEKHLMHHKFCILDLNTTIIGSYNYTFNAQGSDENITIIRNDTRTAEQYKDRFIELRNTHHPNDPLSLKYIEKGKFIDSVYFNALQKIKEQDYDTAINLFSQITEYDDRFYPALQNRGALKAMKGDLEGALSDLIKVLLIQPQNIDALKSLCGVFFHMGDYKNSLSVITKAINYSPNNSDLHYERGRVKMLLNDYLGALPDFKNCIDLNPNDTEAIEDYNECLKLTNLQ